MTAQEIRVAFKALPAKEQENLLRGLAQEHAYQVGVEGLPLPTELEVSASARATAAEGRALRQRAVLKKVAVHLQGELDRGYVLTYEPLAGALWRKRYNDLLGEVEAALGK